MSIVDYSWPMVFLPVVVQEILRVLIDLSRKER
jgi:hypothetical protein